MRHLFITLSMILLTFPVFAQKVKTVEGTYIYHAPENVSLEEAKRTALDRAMIQALADEFGTIVTQANATRVENKNGLSDIDFLSIGGSEVKGEWLETIREPTFDISFQQEMLTVTCRVKGKARAVSTAAIDLKFHILRNGVEDKFESDHFTSGDELYLSFQSPVNGFLAVYLIDAEKRAFCLLPYRNQTDGIFPIKANHRYVFFNEKAAPAKERQAVDEYVMTCNHSSEHNQIYIIFSPNQFTKAADFNADGLPRQLPFRDFQNWLVKCRKYDKDMNLRMIPITIKK